MPTCVTGFLFIIALYCIWSVYLHEHKELLLKIMKWAQELKNKADVEDMRRKRAKGK